MSAAELARKAKLMLDAEAPAHDCDAAAEAASDAYRAERAPFLPPLRTKEEALARDKLGLVSPRFDHVVINVEVVKAPEGKKGKKAKH